MSDFCRLWPDSHSHGPPPQYHSARTALSDIGSSAYQMFEICSVVPDQVMQQSGENPSQVLFHKMLLRMRDGQVTQNDWRHFMNRTPAQVQDLSLFTSALCLFPTTEAVVDHNVSKFHALGQPIATIKAVHTGPNASKPSSDDASGLEPIICLAVGACVMLSSNLWVDMGLVKAICYHVGTAPPDLSVAVTVQFDTYSGPTLLDGTVPITPLCHTWSSTRQCSIVVTSQASLGCYHHLHELNLRSSWLSLRPFHQTCCNV